MHISKIEREKKLLPKQVLPFIYKLDNREHLENYNRDKNHKLLAYLPYLASLGRPL